MTQIWRSLNYLLNSQVLMTDFHFTFKISCTLLVSIKFTIHWPYFLINLFFGSHRFCSIFWNIILIINAVFSISIFVPQLIFRFFSFFPFFFYCCAYSFVLHFFLQWRDSLTQFSWPMDFSVSFLVETNWMAYFNPGWENFYENAKNSHFVKNFRLIASSKWQKKLFSVFN